MNSLLSADTTIVVSIPTWGAFGSQGYANNVLSGVGTLPLVSFADADTNFADPCPAR